MLFVLSFIASCGGDNKQSQSNLNSSIDEEKQFALTLYGDEVKIIARGDLLANGKPSAIAAIVRKQTETSWWIQKGSLIQKINNQWKVILKMEAKLSSAKGELISQVDAKNGYIISFDSSKRPITINIVMANEYGKASSDEGELRWSKEKESFEFQAPYENNAQ
ncbi:MAG: hypothetical protein L0Y79_07250 [Chlorobi bacterium]|nr:hypothetical protein [Chlorobiota bacterium]